MNNSIQIHGSLPEPKTKLLKGDPIHATGGELDLFEETYKKRTISFMNIIFLPFNFKWQIFLAVTIMINIILALYESVFNESVHKDLSIYRIDNYFEIAFQYFSEIFFWMDYILLLLHRNCKRHNATKAYKEVKTLYFLLMLVTIFGTGTIFVPENDALGMTLNKSTNYYFKYLELVVVLRLVRVGSFFSYLINSAYLNIYVCVMLFMSFILMSCTISTCLFYMFVIDRKLVPGSIEEQIMFNVPMIDKDVLSSWPMQNLGDVSLMSFYIVTNCFLMRGQATLQNYSFQFILASLLYMSFSLIFTLIMISLYVVTLLELRLQSLILAFRMESLCSKLKLLNCDRTIVKRIESFYMNSRKKEGELVDLEMKQMLPSSLYRMYTFKTYGPALLHSNLFKKQDAAFLSAISLHMKTEFHFPGHVLFSKGQMKDIFIYLERGIIQVMSCFDSSTPILSLFPGTCMGESTIVFQYLSTSHVVCATDCQLAVLYKKHFDLLKLDFASHCKILREVIIERNKKAQLDYQQRLSNDYSIASGHQEFNSLKKIKRFYRVNDKTSKNKSACHLSYEDLFFKTTKAQHEIKEYINSDSNYLDMFVISESIERTRDDISFLTRDFPLILHPQSPFITLWNNIVLILVSFYVIYIPLYILVDQSDSDMSSDILCGILQAVFIFDLFAQTTFAVFTPEKDLISIKDIFFYRLTRTEFLADVFGSIPLNLIQLFFLKERKIIYRFLQFNHLSRGWRIVQFFNDRINRAPRHRLFFYAVFSMCSAAMFLWYCSVVLLVLSCESRTKCNPNGMWQKIHLANSSHKDKTKLFESDGNADSFSLIVKMFFILTRLTFGTSGDKYIPYTREEHLFVLLISLTSLLSLNFFIAFLTLLAFTMSQSRKDLYEKMIVLVYLSNNYRLDSSLHKRILKRFNLLKQVENSGTHLKGESDFLEIGNAINQDLKFNLWGDSLEKCSIFQNTDRKFARKIASKLNQIILQPHEFVCFSGVFCPYMYIIHRGYCQLIDTENGVVKSTKGPGYEFGGLEMLLGIPMLQSVQSLTYCEIIYLDKNDFYAILEEFPDYKDQIQATKDHCMPLVDLPIIEGRDMFKDEDEPKSKSLQFFGYNLVVGSREEKEFFNPIYEAGKGALFLSRFLMRATILPAGDLIWIMEIIRSIFAFVSCIAFPAHEVMKATYGDNIDVMYSFLDICAYVDIYFRFHVAFYNVDGVLVTHPLYTFINYTKTSLPLDLFACFPFEIILGSFVSGKYHVMLLFNRIFQVHRLFGLLEYIYTSKINIDLHSKALKYFLIMIVFVSASASCWITVQCVIDKNIYNSRPYFTVTGIFCDGLRWRYKTLGNRATPRRVYIKGLFLISTLLTHVNYVHFCEECDNTGWLTISVVYFGFVLEMYVFCKLCALSYLKNKNQHYKQEVNAALTFLSKTGVPKDLENEFCLFFMTCWENQRGETPEELFRETLNDLLQGDIMFEIYGPCLKLNSVFTSSSNSFIRSIVFESKIKIFNKGAHILNEGFVHGDVYVLVDGIICVGTNNKRTSYLEKGAFFGNLYDSKHSQQAIGVSAVTIVETLLINSTNFHRILKTYPVEKTLFEAHRDKYSEVGMKFVPGKVAGTESMMDDIEVLELDSKSKYLLRGKRFDVLKLLLSGTSTFFSFYSLAVFDISPLMLCLLYFMDFIHIVLMFVCCHLPIKTTTDHYITNSVAIRMHYIRKPMNFGLDLLTVFPFETFGLLSSNNMYVFLFLRLNRSLNMIRTWHILNKLCANVTRIQIKLQITLLLVKLLMILNILSLIYTANHITTSSKTYNTCTEKYLMFNAARMMVIASFVKFPHSLGAAHKDYNEFIFVIRTAHLCFNPILLAIVAGNVVYYIHTYFYSVIQFMNQRRSILKRVQFHKTTRTISDTIENYLRFLWDNHHGCQIPPLLLKSPLPLRQKLCWVLYSHHFNEHALFSGCNTLFLRQLIVHLQTQFLFPGNVAVESGIVDSAMYFVHKGEIDVYKKERSQWMCVSKMYAGSCFGIEQGLGRGIAHTHRIVAHTSVTLLKLEFHAWSYLLHYYPAIEKKLTKYLADCNVID